jgi:IclR family KDG regulon transcriptional repressor
VFRLEKRYFVYYTAARRHAISIPMKRTPARPAGRKSPSGTQAAAGDGLRSLQAAFRILDALANAHQPLGLTDVADLLGELKPRLYRHLSTMKRLGVVYQDGRNGRYSLGGRLFSLGEAALEQFDLRFVAAPYLTQLRDRTRQTALLSVPGNGEPVVLSCVEYLDRLSISSRPGNRPPPHCSSQGRIALAFADDAARKRVLAQKLTAFTKHSITDRQTIESRLGVIRGRLFEEANSEVRLGISSVSAPVFRENAELVGIIGIIGTSEEVGAPPSRALVATLHGVAGSLSAQLNCRIYHERGLMS